MFGSLFGMMFLSGFRIPKPWKGAWTILTSLSVLCAASVWLAAPFALWSAAGAWWMTVWAVPTTLAIFALTSARNDMDGG